MGAASIGRWYPLPDFSAAAVLGGIPNPLVERIDFMRGRKRTVQIKFRVTEEERDFIHRKMTEVPTQNMEAYLRKMALDGYIVHVDYSHLKELTSEIQKIGVNINQIARWLNSGGELYAQDIAYIKEAMNAIWQLLRSSLSKAR